jgi:hypothetical protein
MKPITCLLVIAPLAACAQIPPDSTPPPGDGYDTGRCDPRPAATLVGQKATAEAGTGALRLTGARTLRWGPPRTAFTMDYSPMRVNVMYDDAMNITEVTCG